MEEKLTIKKDNFLPIEYIIVNGDLWRVMGHELTGYPKDMFKSLHGSSTLKTLSVYNKFELIPSHTNLVSRIKSKHGYNYNAFKGLSYKPKKGSWENIDKVLKHLGGDNYYNVLLEWLWLTYKFPKHRIVSLAFTGERRSGKTSFLKLCSYLFEDGFLDADPRLVTSSYNQIIAGKIIMSVDEKIDGKEASKELQTIKRNMSAKDIYINPKQKAPYILPNYIRYIFNSNDSNKPFKLEEENERMLVIDVKKIKNSDERILSNMVDEIPAFAYYLANEFEDEYIGRIVGNGSNRFWFPPEILQNEASKRIQKASRPGAAEDIEAIIEDVFYKSDDNIKEVYIKTKTLVKLLNNSSVGVRFVSSMLQDNIKCEYKSSIRPKGNRLEVIHTEYDNWRLTPFIKTAGFFIFQRSDFEQVENNDEGEG